MSSKTCCHLDPTFRLAVQDMKHWIFLKKVCLCLRVGEKLNYTSFLLQIAGMERGVIEFLDDQNWAMHPQPQDSQDMEKPFACFRHRSFYIEKIANSEFVTEDQFHNERMMLDINPRASAQTRRRVLL